MMLYKLMTLVLGCQISFASQVWATTSNQGEQRLRLPLRSQLALSGSAFIQTIKHLPANLREKKIVDEILSGKTLAALAFGWFGISTQLWAAGLISSPICPMIYEPAVCSQADVAAEGGNTCFARAALQKTLLAIGVPFDDQAVRCTLTGRKTARALKNPGATCGIVATTTSCTVEVEGQVLSQSATSCDSPIPELKAQLQQAGFADGVGFTAHCTREQFGQESEFTVPL